MAQIKTLIDKDNPEGSHMTIHELIMALSSLPGVKYSGGDNGENIAIPLADGRTLWIGSNQEGMNEWAGVGPWIVLASTPKTQGPS